MKKTFLALAIASALASLTVKRARTHDTSFTFRMGAGFPGDVNRTHPASITPGLNDATTPVRLFGDPVLINTSANSFRGISTGDTATFAAAGIAVRPYPTQQTTGGMTSTFGTAVPATNQPIDVIGDGYVMVKCNVGTPTKNGAVYVYTAASTGSHVQGGLESAAGSNLTLISNMFFNGPPDASGITEVRVVPASA